VEGSQSIPDLSCTFSTLSLNSYYYDKFKNDQQIEDDRAFARLFLEAEIKNEEITLRAKEDLIQQDEEFARRLIIEEKEQIAHPEKPVTEKPVPEIPKAPLTGTEIKLEAEHLLKDDLLARDLEQMRKDEELAQRLEQTRKDEELARQLFEDEKIAISLEKTQQQNVAPHLVLPVPLRRHALKIHKRYCRCKGNFSDVHLVHVHDAYCKCVQLKKYAPHVHDHSCCTKYHVHNASCRCSKYNPQLFLK